MRITLSTDEAISIKIELEMILKYGTSQNEDNGVLKDLIEQIFKIHMNVQPRMMIHI